MRNCTSINIILDRSGSMSSIKADTIGGINSFIEDQRKEPGECEISLYQFDHEFDSVFQNIDIKTAPALTEKTFIPRGGTALLDAIGGTIDLKGKYFANLPESDRPNKVLFVIMTDGQENSSYKFNNHQITEMIKHQTNSYQWDFIYLGANQDAIATAATMGISAGKALDYNANGVSMLNTNKVMSKYAFYFRSSSGDSRSLSFSDEDRQQVNV